VKVSGYADPDAVALAAAGGVAVSVASRFLDGRVVPGDAGIMARFRAAGLAPIGCTAVPELAISFATGSVRGGITRNPWDLARGTGGSSGRDCAAMLDGTADPGLGARYEIAGPARSYARQLGQDPGRLRVGVMAAAWPGVPAGPACAQTASHAASVLLNPGHSVEEAAPAVDRAVAQVPVGVQVVARYGREDVLFRVASQLEQALPGADRRPPVCAG
jgi:amidase